jgi:hypothetical protein
MPNRRDMSFLAWKVRDKWNRHGQAYAVLSLAFAACVMTKYGRMDAHLLRLLHIFARKRAEMVHVYHRPLVPIEHLLGPSLLRVGLSQGLLLPGAWH